LSVMSAPAFDDVGSVDTKTIERDPAPVPVEPAPAFCDLGSAAFKLLRDPVSGFEVTTATETKDIKASTTFTKKGKKVKAHTSLEVSSGLDFNLTVGTNNKCTVEVAVSDLGTEGSSLRIQSETNKSGITNIDGDVSFANNTASVLVGGAINADDRALTSVNVNGAYKHSRCLIVGLSGAYNFEEKELDVEGAVMCDCGSSQARLSIAKTSSWLTNLSWYHKYSDKLEYATTFGFDWTAQEKTSAEFGASWKIDETTTFRGKWAVQQSLKSGAKFRVGLAANQKVTEYCSASIGVNLNASKFLGRADDDPHSFGFHLSFE